jgi:phenylpropionate dioxygenase-like ring-hydroxylating dioxygenase large terminal subunit
MSEFNKELDVDPSEAQDPAGVGASPGQALLVPPPSKVRASVVRLPGQWFILATAQELGKKPLEKMLLGIPLVLFRDGNGRPGALLDR